MDNMIYTQ